MRIAIDPRDRTEITPEQYLARWGNKALGSMEDLRPRVRCLMCKQQLHHVAGRTEDSHGHFSHMPKSGYCPSKAPAASAYGHLTPVDPDPARGKQIRAQSMLNWRWIYQEVAERVPAFMATEFVELIRTADQDRLWEYRNLSLHQVPELLLVIRDFTPKTSKFRKLWFRFWFSANITLIDDLWITPPGSVRLLRASFPAPEGKQRIPVPEQMLAAKEMRRVGEPHDDYSKVSDLAVKIISSALRVK